MDESFMIFDYVFVIFFTEILSMPVDEDYCDGKAAHEVADTPEVDCILFAPESVFIERRLIPLEVIEHESHVAADHGDNLDEDDDVLIIDA